MAVTVDPFIPKLTKLLFEKMMVPPACCEPSALMVRAKAYHCRPA